MSEWLAARNILAVRMDNIGDVVMLGPALRAVKETLPTAQLTLLASPAGATAASLLPWIDEVITWRAIWQDVGNRLPFAPAHERELIDLLAARHFDAALIFTSFSQTPHVPGYVCYLANIPLRAGESKEFGGATLTTALESAPDDMHQAERNLRLVERLGFSVHARALAIAITAAAREQAHQLLTTHGVASGQRYVLLHPGASAAARRYDPARFGAVAQQLGDHGWHVVITGNDHEAEIIAQVRAVAPTAIYLQGETTLPVFAALVKQAALVICNNTLPLHLADAVGTPAVILYAGTDYESQWQPRAVPFTLLRQPTPCYPCYLFSCPIGLPCQDIAPEAVVAAAVDLLSHSAAQHHEHREEMPQDVG